MIPHPTASCFVIDNDKILLLFCDKTKKWHPPSCHFEPNESPLDAALRAPLLSAGLEVSILSTEHLFFENNTAKSFERPLLCLLKDVPEDNDVPAHQHIEFIYVAAPSCKKEIAPKNKAIWFSKGELEALSEELIGKEVRDIANHVLEKYSTLS
jgi:hypothetical protein